MARDYVRATIQLYSKMPRTVCMNLFCVHRRCGSKRYNFAWRNVIHNRGDFVKRKRMQTCEAKHRSVRCAHWTVSSLSNGSIIRIFGLCVQRTCTYTDSIQILIVGSLSVLIRFAITCWCSQFLLLWVIVDVLPHSRHLMHFVQKISFPILYWFSPRQSVPVCILHVCEPSLCGN